MLAGEELHKLILRAVGVLVLVDHDVLVTPVVALADFAGRFEQAHSFKITLTEIPGKEPLAYWSMNDVLKDKKPLPVAAFPLIFRRRSFSGSLIAFGKLQEILPGRPLQFPLQRVINALILLAAVALGVFVVAGAASTALDLPARRRPGPQGTIVAKVVSSTSPIGGLGPRLSSLGPFFLVGPRPGRI